MAAKVEVMLGNRFNVLNRITWEKEKASGKHAQSCKETLRGFFPNTESIIFCEHYGADSGAKGECGYWTASNKLHQDVYGNVFGKYFLEEFERAKVPRKEIAALFPSRTGGLTGCVSNWILGSNCPTKEQYQTIRDYLNKDSKEEYLRKDYEYLRKDYEDLRKDYEDLRRPFNVTAEVPYTDVWTFPTVKYYKGKHPCEKPSELLEHVIKASSRSEAIVLDCFAGSGSTLIAAKNLGRNFVGIEIDPHWVDVCYEKLSTLSLIA